MYNNSWWASTGLISWELYSMFFNCISLCALGGLYRRADKSLARPGRKQANVSVRMAWISFGALPCRKKKLMTTRVSMLLKLHLSLTCFRARFLPGRTEDLSAPRYNEYQYKSFLINSKTRQFTFRISTAAKYL